MKDEEYLFFSDTREKKNIARSARNKRTHNGKGGRVRLPSDHYTKKELNAMNGEVKTYQLNDPMKWAEFKEMPDDIKIIYIKLLREKFKVPDGWIARMLNVDQKTVSTETTRLGISPGHRCGKAIWDKEGFLAWCNSSDTAKEELTEPQAVEEPDAQAEKVVAKIGPKEVVFADTQRRAIPTTGNMTIEGRTEDVLTTISALLGGADVHISITWDVLS